MGSSSLWSQEDRHSVPACFQGEFPVSWVLGEQLEAEATTLWNQRTTWLKSSLSFQPPGGIVCLYLTSHIPASLVCPASGHLWTILPFDRSFTWSCWVPKTGHLNAEQTRTGLLISCPDSMRRLSKEEATTPGWRLDDKIPRVFLVHYMRFPHHVQKKE